MNISKSPILITGSNRSGTTWVGQVLSQAPNVRGIYEPFSPVLAKSRFDFDLPRWFVHAEDCDEKVLLDLVGRVLRPPLIDRKLELGPIAASRRALRLLLERHGPAAFSPQILLKDPIAIFSADWLASIFGMSVVVLIRHPAAYVLSLLKDARHMHPFRRTFLEQPYLMEKFSPKEKGLIHEVIRRQDRGGVGGDMVFEASVAWRLFYSIVLRYRSAHPEWHYVFYEDLALQPMAAFEKLCGDLDLVFSDSVRCEIGATAMVRDPQAQDTTSHVKKFQSELNVNLWETQLSSEEIARVSEIVGDVGAAFYPKF